MKTISKIELMKKIEKLNRIDEELYEFIKPHKRYGEHDQGWFFLDYHNVLDIVYYEFYGEKEHKVYSKFDTPSRDSKDKPVAWYTT
jgi:hypothetical protein